jgi:hypothetical protein
MRSGQNMLAMVVAAGCILFTSAAGCACSLPLRKLTAAQARQQARSDLSRASAVIDAEVIVPMRFGKDWKPGLTPTAYIKVLNIWKGTVERDLPLVYISSCDISLERKGEKLRILLLGNGVFRADRGMNGGGILNLMTYQAEIDRLIGQRRSRALMHFPGAIPAPTHDQATT